MGNRYGEQILYNPVKPIGLYQTSDVPGTVKFRGYNAYRVVVMLLMLYLSIMATLIGATCVYYWNTARMTSIVSLTMSLSYFHVCYKAWFVVYHHSADVIWECLSVARFNYNGSGLQDGRKRLARAWRNRTVRALYAYGIIVLTALSVYVTCPLVFDDTTVAVVRRDGSTGNYRQTVYNLHLFGETVYNAYFGWVYCAEVSCSMIYLLFSGMFDTTLITVSATLLCQLQAVGTAFELVGQKTIPDVRHQTGIRILMTTIRVLYVYSVCLIRRSCCFFVSSNSWITLSYIICSIFFSVLFWNFSNPSQRFIITHNII